MDKNSYISFYQAPELFNIVNFASVEQIPQTGEEPVVVEENDNLLCVETFGISPQNYDLKNWKKYKTIITWNSKLYYMYKKHFNMKLISTFPYMSKTFLDDGDFTSYEDKDGVCLICRYRKKVDEFDLSEKRLETIENINNCGYFKCHTYGMLEYGANLYQGKIGSNKHTIIPSSYSKIKKLSEYKFNICFENYYHPLWSWDYITEKIYDCFSAKTVPIYYGAYNIQLKIPNELYIDYRKFKSDEELNDYLKTISKNQYEDMVESAYELYQEVDFTDYIKVIKDV